MMAIRTRLSVVARMSVFVAFGALAGCVAQAPSGQQTSPGGKSTRRSNAVDRSKASSSALPEVSSERFLAHISLLAHDELGGRGTGSDGIDIAAGYIAGQFAAAGLQPGGPQGTYFQPFTIPSDPKLSDTSRLAVSGWSDQPVLREDFIPFGFSAIAKVEGDVVFVGYGIIDPEHDHDDYASIDVTGKVVLMLRREPAATGDGPRFSSRASFQNKMKWAIEKGAAAVLIANQKPGDDDVDALTRFGGRAKAESIPAIHISRKLADALLAAGGLPALDSLQLALDTDHRNVSAPLKDLHVEAEVAYESNDMPSRNVLGVLPGAGPRAGEYVVIGAHYDHLGTRRGEIHNGADDNASGSSGVIEICRLLAKAAYRDRSVLCMTFTGEEIGLLGSEYWVGHPTVPLEAVTSMINLDMIGRWNPSDEANKLAIQGLGTGTAFQEIADRRAAEAGIEYVPDPSARGPSDHASFYHGGIPSLFFFTGVHPDYHQPGDDVEKINAEGGARIATLVSRIALDLINADSAPVFAKVDQPARIFRGAAGPGSGVVMGIMPDMEDESPEPGWKVGGVLPGGGADKGGMKAGDRIIKIGEQAIGGFEDYRKATADKKPGDVVPVTVRRGKEELTLNVELAARG